MTAVNKSEMRIPGTIASFIFALYCGDRALLNINDDSIFGQSSGSL
jgi:hypothetical protein